MRLNYKRLGEYIQQVNNRNTDLKVERLLGVSIQKILMPSIANIVGTNMKTYKIINKNQFAYGPVTSRNGNKVSIALLEKFTEAIVSQAYTVFEIIDFQKLMPEYLMMWFRRPEFDRYARFKSHGSARETFDWDEMCNVELPIPSIEKQKAIVKEYNTIVNRIKLNEELNKKLEETAQAIYKQWFVDFEFPNKDGKPYKSSGGRMVWNEELGKEIPEGWEVDDLANQIEHKKGMAFKSSEYVDNGIPVVKVSTFTNNSIDLSDCNFLPQSSLETYKDFILKTNDIIISTVGSWPQNPDSVVGKVIKVPPFADKALLNQNAVRITSQILTQGYLYFSLKNNDFSDFVISGAQGSANQASITLDHVFSYKICIPKTLYKQKAFKVFDKCLENIGCKETETVKLNLLVETYLSKMAKGN